MAGNRLERSVKITLLGLGVNILLAAGKLTAGLFGHSYALVADAVESVSDIFTSMVVWRGIVVAEEPADAEHPYGHGKAEPIAASIVSSILLLAATGIVFTAIHAILTPRTSTPAKFTLFILLVVVVVKELLFRVVSNEAGNLDNTAIKADAWHHRSDALTSLAAVAGIAVTLYGGKFWQWADAAAAMVAAGIIGLNGLNMLKNSLNELMDAAPQPEVVNAIRKEALAVQGVHDVEKCIVRKSGHRYWVELHLEVPSQLTVKVGHEIAHAVKDRIRLQHPAVHDVLVHIEPANDH